MQIINSWVKIINSKKSLFINTVQALQSAWSSTRKSTSDKLKSHNHSWCKFKKKWFNEWSWIIRKS